MVFAATFILTSCLTFWLVGSAEVDAAFTYGGNTMTSYPLSIYGPWLRRIFSFVVPLAFVTYFPGLYLLDKPDPLGFPTAFQFLAPVVAARVRGADRCGVAVRGAPLPEYGLVIRVDEVSKSFTRLQAQEPRSARARHVVHAVENVSFSVDAGEMVGYVGPNGAGKSTTIKMLTGVLVPTSGSVDVGGLVPHRERVALARRIGIGVRSALTAVVGPPPRRLVRRCCATSTRSANGNTRRASRSARSCSTSRRSSTHRCGSCRWGNGCGAS